LGDELAGALADDSYRIITVAVVFDEREHGRVAPDSLADSERRRFARASHASGSA
jgi:hypothetical protein